MNGLWAMDPECWTGEENDNGDRIYEWSTSESDSPNSDSSHSDSDRAFEAVAATWLVRLHYCIDTHLLVSIDRIVGYNIFSFLDACDLVKSIALMSRDAYTHIKAGDQMWCSMLRMRWPCVARHDSACQDKSVNKFSLYVAYARQVHLFAT